MTLVLEIKSHPYFIFCFCTNINNIHKIRVEYCFFWNCVIFIRKIRKRILYRIYFFTRIEKKFNKCYKIKFYSISLFVISLFLSTDADVIVIQKRRRRKKKELKFFFYDNWKCFPQMPFSFIFFFLLSRTAI